jgi:hypothetical protein
MRRRDETLGGTSEQHECGWASYSSDKEWVCKHGFQYGNFSKDSLKQEMLLHKLSFLPSEIFAFALSTF